MESSATYPLVHVNGVLAGDNVLDGGARGLAGRLLGLGRHGCVKRLLSVLKRNEFWAGGGAMVMARNEEGIVGGKKLENSSRPGKELCMRIVGVRTCGSASRSLAVEE